MKLIKRSAVVNMSENKTISSRVREEIPNILKSVENINRGLRFNELFKKLKKKFPNELVNENNEDRIGVLRGIVNKLEDIPIQGVRMEKRGNEIFFVFVSDELTELSRASEQFLSDLRQRKLTSIDVLSLQKTERDFYNEFIKIITDLNDVLKDFESQKKGKN